MRYNVKIKLGENTIYEVEVEALDEESAMEFAYEQLEMDTYTELTMISSVK